MEVHYLQYQPEEVPAGFLQVIILDNEKRHARRAFFIAVALSYPLRFVGPLAASCLALGWLAPIHYYPWLAFWNDLPVAVALCLLLVTLAISSAAGTRLQVRAVWLGGVAIIPWAQYGLGLITHSGDAWIVSLYLFGAAIAYVIGQSLRSAKIDLPAILYAFALACVFASIISTWIGLRQAFDQNGEFLEVGILRGWRSVANLAQPNQFSSLVLLGIASVFYLGIYGRLSVRVVISAVLFLGLGLATAQSRTILIALPALMLWINRGTHLLNEPIKHRQGSVLAFCLLAVLVIWFSWPHLYGLWSISGDFQRDAEDPTRLVMWAQFIDAALQRPLLGYGWNQIAFAQLGVANLYAPSLYVESAHNLVLDLVLWNGLVVGGGLVGAAVLWGAGWLKRCSTLSQWYCVSLMLPLAIHSLVEYPLHYAYFLLPIFFIAGLLDAERLDLRTMCLPRLVIVVVAVMVCTVFGMVVSDYLGVEEQIRESRFVGARFSTTEKTLQPEEGAQSQSEVIFLTQLALLRDISKLSYHDEASDLDPAFLKQAVERYPLAIVLFQWSIQAILRGEIEAGEASFCLIRQLHGAKAFDRAVRNLRNKQKNTEALRRLNYRQCVK